MNNIDKIITNIVNDQIREEARTEALEILNKCSDARFKEFLTYHYTNKGNLCCMVLDVAKSELVGENKMIHNYEDWFGFPYLETSEKENY